MKVVVMLLVLFGVARADSEWFCSRLAAAAQAHTDAPIIAIASGQGETYSEVRKILAEKGWLLEQDTMVGHAISPLYMAEHFTHPVHHLMSLWWHLPTLRWCLLVTLSDVI